ncbi:MAG TPA: BrnT family toxin [Burkholderiaceae bacterium]|nr:BrnT family toxin [Burkholderiaceae bacterium]
MLQITFDPAKDASNQAKHGVSLVLAKTLEWDTLMCKPDARRDYGEQRLIGYAIAGDRLYCVVFVDRPEGAPTERRIISLRKANSREVKSYANING